MRVGIRKHYKGIANFVMVANLGWKQLDRGEFQILEKLNPDAHRALLERVERAASRRLSKLRSAASVPPMFLPNWDQWPRTLWPALHAYALVRRLFDSLDFLTRAHQQGTPGVYLVPMSLQIGPTGKTGSLSRLRDPFEEFLAELDACDLNRIRACPVCHKFFIAWRKDQKACSRRCANVFRVWKFRANTRSTTFPSRHRRIAAPRLTTGAS